MKSSEELMKFSYSPLACNFIRNCNIMWLKWNCDSRTLTDVSYSKHTHTTNLLQIILLFASFMPPLCIRLCLVSRMPSDMFTSLICSLRYFLGFFWNSKENFSSFHWIHWNKGVGWFAFKWLNVNLMNNVYDRVSAMRRLGLPPGNRLISWEKRKQPHLQSLMECYNY